MICFIQFYFSVRCLGVIEFCQEQNRSTERCSKLKSPETKLLTKRVILSSVYGIHLRAYVSTDMVLKTRQHVGHRQRGFSMHHMYRRHEIPLATGSGNLSGTTLDGRWNYMCIVQCTVQQHDRLSVFKWPKLETTDLQDYVFISVCSSIVFESLDKVVGITIV